MGAARLFFSVSLRSGGKDPATGPSTGESPQQENLFTEIVMEFITSPFFSKSRCAIIQVRPTAVVPPRKGENCPMAYLICTQPVNPRMDALPAYKIIHYPLEKRDYKPFAQVKLCLTPQELIVEMWAFEMLPRPESNLRGLLTADGSRRLWLRAWPDGRWECTADGPAGEEKLDAIAHTLDGEDLQGIYWGMSIRVPCSQARQVLGPENLRPGGSLLGNFYKLSDNKDKPHKGSLYPADFAGGREYALSSLARFQVVNY